MAARKRRWLWRTGAAVLTILAFLIGAVLFGAYGYWPTEERSYQSKWRQSVDSRFVETAVARIHYVKAGSGSPVILIPPSPGWAQIWRRQIPELARSHTVYAVDLPGNTGYTSLKDKNFRYDLSAITGALGQFMDAVGVHRAALVGNSWGGGFALRFAQQHPERVSKLVLLDSSGLDLPDPSSWETMKYPVLGELLTKLGTSRSTLRDMVRNVVVDPSAVTAEDLDETYAPMTFRENVRAIYAGERALDWRETDRALAATKTPTLIIWGKQDKVYPVERAEIFGRRLPNATVLTLEECSHSPQLDCAVRVNPALVDFLRDAQ
jgi:pimeloyl-ACP methyl ester carboxylesterase